MFKDLFDKEVIKIVCGAANEDTAYIEKLVKLYSMAGIKYFDVSASKEVIEAAMRGAQGREIYINVSIGIPGDPHINKAFIEGKCGSSQCIICSKICRYGAIVRRGEERIIDKNKCMGCGECESKCPYNNIKMKSMAKSVEQIFPSLPWELISSVEVHIMGDLPEVDSILERVQQQYDGPLSICLDRSKFSDNNIQEFIKSYIFPDDPRSLIIQADGSPISGDDKKETTLQAIAIAQLIDRMKLPVYLMISGGTNQYTREYLKEFNVKYDGIAFGSYARTLVKSYLDDEDFFNNPIMLYQAIQKIQENILGWVFCHEK
jgi:Fe-S-cluster-containing hydrogenase component 2